MTESNHTDVLVIGGGGAACYSAVKAAKEGASVTLVDKGKLGSSGSTSTCGGHGPEAVVPAVNGGDPTDSQDILLSDMVIGGAFLSEQEMCSLALQKSTDVLFELDSWGLPSDKHPDGTFHSTKVMGMSRRRAGLTARVGNEEGGQIVMDFFKKLLPVNGVDIIEGMMITDILLKGDRVVGAVGLRKDGTIEIISSKSVIIATGSATKLYPYTGARYHTTGDGYAMALSAGLSLINMEFQEFSLIPVVDGAPWSTQGTKPLTKAGARWINAAGERIMERYDPNRLELTTRAMMVRANYMERAAGRGPVYLDLSYIPENERPNIAKIFFYRKLKEIGKEPFSEKFEWVPSLHTFLGGIRTNNNCETYIKGLYAAGEASGQGGVFGADRTGSGLGLCYALGSIAGTNAAHYSKGVDFDTPKSEDISSKKERLHSKLQGKSGKKSCDEVLHTIQKLAWDCAGVARRGQDVERGISEIRRIRAEQMQELSLSSTEDVISSIELENLAAVAEAVFVSAFERKESRGQHFRLDYPNRDDRNWMRWITVSKSAQGLEIGTLPIPVETYAILPRSK